MDWKYQVIDLIHSAQRTEFNQNVPQTIDNRNNIVFEL